MPEPVAPDPTAAVTDGESGGDVRRVVMIGPVTWDDVDGVRLPGGPVSFAARTAEAFGVRLQVVALAGSDADLEALEGQEVVVVDAGATLAMDHVLVDGERSIRVPVTTERAVVAEDVPAGWLGCSDLVLAPLLPDELDATGIAQAVGAERLWVLAQGLQRVRATDGAISFLDRPSAELDGLVGPATSVFLSRDETDPWSPGAVEGLAERCSRVVVTQGQSGSVVMYPHRSLPLPAVPAAPVDTTGAGDVFATAFILACEPGVSDERAVGRLAAGFAAAAVELSGPARLPSRAEIEARVAATTADGESRAGGSR